MTRRTNGLYDRVASWELPRSVVDWSYDEMRRRGAEKAEGIAFWAGRAGGGVARISHAIVVRGRHVLCRRGILELDAAVINDLTDVLLERELYLIGQVHSHPPGCSVSMSDTDRRFGIVAPDFLSVIVPDYARPDWHQQAGWGVHVYEPPAGWRRLREPESTERLVLTDTAGELVTLGEGPDA